MIDNAKLIVESPLDPIGEDVDGEWENAMGKISRERLNGLVRSLGLKIDIDIYEGKR